ncbi:SH3 domain-containing protein [bacterium 210820-DFI.6.37]|nr:SH3 domain-containing protein [bacterium 210820-DFI.6.37]
MSTKHSRSIALITAMFMILTLFAVLPATGSSDVYGATKGTIKNGPLNVRSNAGTKYKKLGTIAKGKTITIKGTKKDKAGTKWYKFTFKSKTGYVCAKYVTVKSSLGAIKAYSPTKKGTIKNGPLNVRSNAGTKYKKLGTVKKKASVTVTGERTSASNVKWYRIKFGSKTGYVMAKYVTVKAAASTSSAETAVNKKATIKNGPLNVRSGAGTSYSKLGTVAKGKVITVLTKKKNTAGQTWYKFAYSSSKKGWVLSNYVTLGSSSSSSSGTSSSSSGSGLSDAEFEKWMTSQGFPDSYKSKLRTLHKAHPKWIFKAQKTGLTWSSMLAKETKVGINLVEPTSPSSWKSKASGAYNSKTGVYTKFDGRWNAASEKIIAYYMDPRNFLTEASIYQFMDHKFDSASQNKNTIKSMVSRSSCFMNTTKYISYLYNAGVNSKVNPNVITAMVIMEQGWKGGSGLISGTYPGYKGYYNHFNIGAYTTSTMNSIQRGLWWAKGAGTGATSYGRPWNTIEKSLSGGASYYSSNYLTNNQYTYYTKKFNVMNGLSNVASHQYMTNTSGAESEGKILKYAYEASDNYPIVFYIPVYNSMPSTACAKPS